MHRQLRRGDPHFDFTAHQLRAFANRSLEVLVQRPVVLDRAGKASRLGTVVDVQHARRDSGQHIDATPAGVQTGD